VHIRELIDDLLGQFSQQSPFLLRGDFSSWVSEKKDFLQQRRDNAANQPKLLFG
jgi:hypothetical protein